MNLIALPTAGLIILENQKLLLAHSKNKNAWYLPGGKIDAGESPIEALQREIQEELNLVLNPSKLKYYCHITAPAYGEMSNIIMEQDCFIYELEEEIQPGNEITEVRFFEYTSYLLEPAQVVGVLDVFQKLIGDKMISR